MPGCIDKIRGKVRFENEEFHVEDSISIKKNSEENWILTNENCIVLPDEDDFQWRRRQSYASNNLNRSKRNLNLVCSDKNLDRNHPKAPQGMTRSKKRKKQR